MWIPNDLLRCLMICTLLLAFKFAVTNIQLGVRRHKAGLRSPEDEGQNNAPTAEEISNADRAARVVNNDVENLIIGLILLWGSALCIDTAPLMADSGFTDSSFETKSIRAHIAFTIAFTASRFIHSLWYSLGMASHIRGCFWSIGWLAVIGAGITGAISAYRTQLYL